MNELRLVIPGEPQAQQRPRFTTRGGGPHAYDPAKSRHAKRGIGVIAAEKMAGLDPMTGPLELTVIVRRTPPVSWSKRRRAEAIGQGITGKPDIDNYVKLVQDALNGIVYEDDKDITELHARKVYTDGDPETEIIIRRLVS